jgi:folate-binding protein YgfZ
MSPSILEPLHRAAGARFAGESAGSALLTYGSVPEEYRAGSEGCALFDAADRGSLAITGRDRVEFLHRILSNHVRGMEPGQGRRQLLLSPKGKVVADFELVAEADRFRARTGPGGAPALATALDMFLFSDDVQFADRSAESAPLELCGPRAEAVVEGICGAQPALALYHGVRIEGAFGSLLLERVPVAGSLGWRLDAGPGGVEGLWRALVAAGARPAGRVAHDCLRVEACAPSFGVDVDDQVYPQEARLEEAFALDKGCYIGQEVVAKIDTYGGLNKRLVPLAISHDDPLPRGTKLLGHDAELGTTRELGIVTSWAYSFVLDRGLVLAYVKRKHQAVGKSFGLEGHLGTATVVAAPVRSGARPLTGEFES